MIDAEKGQIRTAGTLVTSHQARYYLIWLPVSERPASSLERAFPHEHKTHHIPLFINNLTVITSTGNIPPANTTGDYPDEWGKNLTVGFLNQVDAYLIIQNRSCRD